MSSRFLFLQKNTRLTIHDPKTKLLNVRSYKSMDDIERFKHLPKGCYEQSLIFKATIGKNHAI